MATKPILFNSKMISAILDGNKIQTRRILKPANRRKSKIEDYHQGDGLWIDTDENNGDHCGHIKDYSISPMWWTMPSYIEKYAPYQIGDNLYVREKFCIGAIATGEEADGRTSLYVSQCNNDNDYIPYEYCIRHNIGIDDVIWKPSLHMPKDAARIFLKVKDVKIGKLQSISEEDAMREGCLGTRINCINEDCEKYGNCWSESPINEFGRIWDDTVDKREKDRYGWNANPWVWVIEFEKKWSVNYVF